VVIYFAMGDRSQGMLAKLNDWMSRNNAVIMSIICVRGIHLTGLVQASGAPRPGGRRAVDAGRLPPLTWR